MCEDESQALPTLRVSTYALFEACRPLRKRWSLLKKMLLPPPASWDHLKSVAPPCVFRCLNYLKIFHGDVFIVGESVGLLLKNASAPPGELGPLEKCRPPMRKICVKFSLRGLLQPDPKQRRPGEPRLQNFVQEAPLDGPSLTTEMLMNSNAQSRTMN